MEIIRESTLDKALEVPENFRQKPWNTIYEVIYDEYFK